MVTLGNVPLPLLSRTETEFPTACANARSGFPSRLKSPDTTAEGEVMAVEFAAANVPVPLPMRTLKLAAVLFAVTMSGFPSAFTSATTTD